ncbi:hypothetical protein ACA910_016977 [Epithemia clementina (nom. ined.)]
MNNTIKDDGDNRDSGNVSPLLQLKQNVSTGDLLELAGNYYCGEPIASILLCKPIRIPNPRAARLLLPSSAGRGNNETDAASKNLSGKIKNGKDMMGLPPDAWIHTMSFLTPKDVIAFGCTCKASLKWVEEGETSNLLWKTLWRRDYAWIIQRWTVGRKAAARSLPGQMQPEPSRFSKLVYCRFGLCYLDYVLAGCNTFDECLVGIGGHIYDMSLFLLSHPGSPETVMVHAGQDATDFFRRIGHSKGAQRLARSMCVVVDQTRLSGEGVGLAATPHTKFSASTSDHGRSWLDTTTCPVAVKPPEESATTTSSGYSTLVEAQTEFETQRQVHQAMVLRRFSKSSFVTQPKVFYDPLTERWQAWCMDSGMNTVFIDNID